ncbi:MAG: BON domain-containing protein, partial [Rhodobacteraceae bacterium]|nr:BON domain-containing protein [Paracoccaceae bacterium]
MKLKLPKHFPPRAIGPAVFAGTGLVCLLLSIWTVHAIERFSKLGVRRALAEAGHSWAEVEADGLKVILTGTAPTEAMRFRALSVAGNVVDSARLRDAMQVADQARLADPDFKMELLRNDDGISLIGLAPTAMDRDQLLTSLDALAEDDHLTNMLESADHPVPAGWDSAVAFAENALKSLPRAKISVAPGKVKVTAITDTPEQKRDLEARLRRNAPRGMTLTLEISAPHPVSSPFTLRFLIDANGARFDACSADSDKARERILAAAQAAGASDKTGCRVGLGVPSPDWADAVVLALAAMKQLGNGAITFSDADIALVAGPEVPQATFD